MVCRALAPSHQVNYIRFFTALIQPRSPDLQIERRERQRTYLRALETIPNLTLHYGQFRPRRKRRPLVNPLPDSPQFVEILDTEEKGTDVNLATYLLVDGFEGEYEQAVVISNDSDLALPVRMVRERLGLAVGVVNPNRDQGAFTPKELSDAATFIRRLRPNTLRDCQFPGQLTDVTGLPVSWAVDGC